NSNGEKHTAFIQFSNRDPALNGSHGASAFITMSTPSGTGTYGTGQFDFYCRNGAPYAFPNDPQAASSYWMSSLFTIKSNGNVGVADNNPAAKFVVNNGTNNAQFVQMRNEEVGLFFGAYGTGSTYPREATINGSRIDSGSLPYLRIAGQGGIKFCVDLNTPRAQINSSGHFLVGNSTTQFTTSAIPVVFGSGSGTNGISIYAGASSTSFIHFADGTSGAQRYAGSVGYNHSDEQLNLSVNDTTRVRIHDSNFREIIFPQQHENTYAQRVYRTTVSANANSYTKFATVSGPSYGTHIKMSTTSTIGNVVTTGDFEIKVGHSNDVLIISKTLAYTNMTVKV
ncbi:MAG: hypothetical protein VXY93_12430, partial [Pseudomonadota bacterium]|nr:hypothetical protein [Pseudomonadota bacterium]